MEQEVNVFGRTKKQAHLNIDDVLQGIYTIPLFVENLLLMLLSDNEVD